MCVEAERGEEDMMQHGLEGEDAAAGAGFDPSVDADDEEGDTDISQAAISAQYLGRINNG